MTQQEVTLWEIENASSIFKWEVDYEAKQGCKVVTFFLKDKTTQTFDIETQ